MGLLPVGDVRRRLLNTNRRLPVSVRCPHGEKVLRPVDDGGKFLKATVGWLLGKYFDLVPSRNPAEMLTRPCTCCGHTWQHNPFVDLEIYPNRVAIVIDCTSKE